MKNYKVFALALTALLFCATVSFGEEESKKKPDNYIGAGVLMRECPYVDCESKSLPVPLFYWHKDNWFIEGTKGGYTIFKKGNFKAKAILAPRLMGYDDDDAAILNGAEDRDMSLDAGIELKLLVPELSGIELNAGFVNDVLNIHKGNEAKASVAKEFKGKIFLFKPSAGVKWQSANLVDYYYGVRATETTASRPEYNAKTSSNHFANLDFYLGLPKDFLLVTSVGFEHLGDAIERSPITDDNGIFSCILGVVRKF
ncbi:MAG: MipA/OmpV family protein [Candidatus Omnitrophica bacterium]|nr:MipA/OmpV family protein [Candidatus Omnitrophota bacterium]